MLSTEAILCFSELLFCLYCCFLTAGLLLCLFEEGRENVLDRRSEAEALELDLEIGEETGEERPEEDMEVESPCFCLFCAFRFSVDGNVF